MKARLIGYALAILLSNILFIQEHKIIDVVVVAAFISVITGIIAITAKEKLRRSMLCTYCASVLLLFLGNYAHCVAIGNSHILLGEIEGAMMKIKERSVTANGYKYIALYKNENVLLYDENKYEQGMYIEISGMVEMIKQPTNQGEFNMEKHYKSQNVFRQICVENSKLIGGEKTRLSKIRETIHQKIVAQIGRVSDFKIVSAQKDEGMFLSLLLGETGELDEDLRAMYSQVGIAHILAVSGLHLSIIGLGLFRVLKRLIKGYTIPVIITSIFVIGYGTMIYASLACLRAIIMFILSLVAKMLGRKYHIIRAYFVALLLLLIEFPYAFYNVGFCLSFSAVLGVIVLYPLLKDWLDAKGNIQEAMLGYVAIQMATLPVLLTAYYELAWYGMIANLLLVPLMPLLLVCIIVTVQIKWAVLPASALLRCYEWICQWLVKLFKSPTIFGAPSLWAITIHVAIWSGLLCWIFIKRERYRQRTSVLIWRFKKEKLSSKVKGIRYAVLVLWIGISIFLMKYVPLSKEELVITTLDVSQGDGIIMHIPKGQTLVFDGGSSDAKGVGKRRMIPYLKYHGVRRIDAWFISHFDEDHCSGLVEILESSIEVSQIIVSKYAKDDEAFLALMPLLQKENVRIYYMEEGEVFLKNKLRIQCVSATNTGDTNEDSMVLRMEYGTFSMLLTGDIGEDTEKKLVEKNIKPCTILKVAHHGSRFSTSEEFLNMVSPKLAIISVSERNTYNHPHPNTLERLKRAGAVCLTTNVHGAVTVRMDKGRLYYQVMK